MSIAMEWELILTGEEKKTAEMKLNNIFRIINEMNYIDSSNDLMYGNMGIALFLYKYSQHLDQDELFTKASEYFQDVFFKLQQQIFSSPKFYDFQNINYQSNMSEIGWCINYLIEHELIIGDIQNIFSNNNPQIYRLMIDAINEPNLHNLHCGIRTGLYCLGCNSRLSKEYIIRFIGEFYINTHNHNFEEQMINLPPSVQFGMLSFLLKVKSKYNNLSHVDYLIQWQNNLFVKMQSKPHDLIDDLWILYAQLKNDVTSEHAINSLITFSKSAINMAGEIKVESGLSGGIGLYAHLFNRIYHNTKINFFKVLARTYYCKLLTATSHNFSDVHVDIWLTASNGIWGLQHGLANGISGIGLTLLSAISEDEPQWDEILFLN